jgi:hypothetical protein
VAVAGVAVAGVAVAGAGGVRGPANQTDPAVSEVEQMAGARSGCDDRVRRRARTRNRQRVLLWSGDSATVSAATARR